MFELMPMTRSQRSMNSFWNDFEKSFFGAYDRSMSEFKTDIIDNGGSYLLQAELPGYSKEEISLKLDDNYLTIKAEKKEENEEKKENFVRRERRYGSYSRSFDITGIDAENITASYNNGVLDVTLPKVVETKKEPKQIEIQ